MCVVQSSEKKLADTRLELDWAGDSRFLSLLCRRQQNLRAWKSWRPEARAQGLAPGFLEEQLAQVSSSSAAGKLWCSLYRSLAFLPFPSVARSLHSCHFFFFKDCSNIDWGPSCPSMTSSRLCLPPSCFQIRPHSEMLDIRDTWRDAYQCHPLGTYFFSPNIPASSYLTAIFRWMSFPLWDSLPLLQRLIWQVSLFSYSINS